MSDNHFISILLNLKEKNITFDKILEENIKGTVNLVIYGKLINKPNNCPCCGSSKINIHGYKVNTIKLMPISGFNALLKLNKQRYKCKNCNKTFIATTNFVDFHKQISNDTNLNIKLELMQKGSEKDIAKRNNVSPKHVNIIMDQIAKDTLIKGNGKLPEIMGIDEFNATKDTKSKLAFIIVDQKKHNIFDINNSRLSLDLEKYFKRYSKDERDKVKFII